MADNYNIIDSYGKGNSNIKGEFLFLNEDPNNCIVQGFENILNLDLYEGPTFFPPSSTSAPVFPPLPECYGFEPFYLNGGYTSDISVDLEQWAGNGTPPPVYTSLNTVTSSSKFLVKIIEESKDWDEFDAPSKIKSVGHYESKITSILNESNIEIQTFSGYISSTWSRIIYDDALIICNYDLTLDNNGWSGTLTQITSSENQFYLNAYGSYTTSATNYPSRPGTSIHSETKLIPQGINPNSYNRIDNLNAPIPLYKSWAGSILHTSLVVNATGRKQLLYPCEPLS